MGKEPLVWFMGARLGGEVLDVEERRGRKEGDWNGGVDDWGVSYKKIGVGGGIVLCMVELLEELCRLCAFFNESP